MEGSGPKKSSQRLHFQPAGMKALLTEEWSEIICGGLVASKQDLPELLNTAQLFFLILFCSHLCLEVRRHHSNVSVQMVVTLHFQKHSKARHSTTPCVTPPQRPCQALHAKCAGMTGSSGPSHSLREKKCGGMKECLGSVCVCV